ncbi:uncharacterized protein M421DRAFT_224992 [Didymella exigua CBS 183.55]|uniref:C2H2-type domain-containing protein n=1 Tax=Didymella exigua CBS 183.55 TaxID=1150837 RepID=A0A6A5RGB0_9PLEO|nr:uncharacterized protein M421DRAFT_224992 [Didymella exigua CBS 183.55]KAF1926114.1 hypothetical protein M421DRAFT_224992 [Didymella exigua CBS 183.55]
MRNHMISAFPDQGPDLWTSAPIYQQPLQQSLQHPRLSVSTQASSLSDSRMSSGSDISGWQRSSVASTNSSWSNSSKQAYYQRRSSLASISSINEKCSMSLSYAASPAEEAASPLSQRSKRKPKQRQGGSDKDPFATCVSRARQSRRSPRDPSYWCTSCEEPFVEKYDWKRHEETYQERRFVFQCNLCTAIYFLEKDFLHHHETRHHCETCHRDGHLNAAKQDRQIRTGWGCGFCTHFSNNWRDRCNHIAQHFEKDGKTTKDWHQTDVILSLLQRPAIRAEWLVILQSQLQLRADFGWNQHNTGCVEGYPENGKTPHLQDQLEYFSSSDDAAALAQLAFSKIAFPPHPPQAPRKDYKDHHTVSLQSLMDQAESWQDLMNTIPDDPLLPENVCNFDFDFSIADITYDDDAEFI